MVKRAKRKSTKNGRRRASTNGAGFGGCAEPKSPSQREILRDVMLSATACGTWLTLRELSQTTRFGEASISAQLRHLRKREYGGFVIERRLRPPDTGVYTATEPRWEYRLGGSSAMDTVMSWRTTELLRDAIQTARRFDTPQNESPTP